MVDFSGFHVGKYTSPMDGMGDTSTYGAEKTPSEMTQMWPGRRDSDAAFVNRIFLHLNRLQFGSSKITTWMSQEVRIKG